jgi:tetratricopeptide (TPR) repeat protein
MRINVFYILAGMLLFSGCTHAAEKEYARQIKDLVDAEKYKEAVEISDKAIEKYPKSSEIYYQRGWARLSFSADNAKADFQKAVDLKSDNFAGYNGLGVISIIKHDYTEADQYLQKALALTKEPEQKATVLSNIAAIQSDLKNYGKTISILHDAIKLAKKSDFYSDLGTALYLSGKLTDALNAFEEGLMLDQFLDKRTRHRTLFKAAALSFELKQKDKAKKFISEAMILSPSNQDYIKLNSFIENN